ncbi:hypothetical protein GSH05_06000 [Burkholderia pseudomallei]|nr:hypothetical protein BOC43_03175 [Burkholderia pseudomallei]PNX02446.1 hypothetical protein CF649_16170 [Burkholderia sp. 136(2017)]PNX11089.1 hypothetical protein CF650_32525 [Burkholderia sp. 129]PNX28786.1 hypothetical protein CF647_16200 [Burkholderia sp. 117]PNX37996.1 hypothetical protein CF648_16175 [Burkholderia sp. 137]
MTRESPKSWLLWARARPADGATLRHALPQDSCHPACGGTRRPHGGLARGDGCAGCVRFYRKRLFV